MASKRTSKSTEVSEMEKRIRRNIKQQQAAKKKVKQEGKRDS